MRLIIIVALVLFVAMPVFAENNEKQGNKEKSTNSINVSSKKEATNKPGLNNHEVGAPETHHISREVGSKKMTRQTLKNNKKGLSNKNVSVGHQ
jgi:hypothetical protein